MEYVNNTHEAIIKGIHEAVMDTLDNFEGVRESPYRDGWMNAMSYAEDIITHTFKSQKESGDMTATSRPATDSTSVAARTPTKQDGSSCEKTHPNHHTISTEDGMVQLLQGTEKLLREYNSADHTADYERGWFAAFFGVQDIIHEILRGEMKRIEELIESLSDSSIVDDDELDDDWSDEDEFDDDDWDDWDNDDGWDDDDEWDEDWDDDDDWEDDDDELGDYTPIEPCPENDSTVNHPSHYNTGRIEVIDFLEDQKLSFHLGNAVKYICRAGKKNPNKTVEDLEKAVWYLNRYIGLMSETEKKHSVDAGGNERV